MTENILQVKGLQVWYDTREGPLNAVNDVSFSLKKEERFGLVGESGSGKTTLATALMRLIKPPGQIKGGEVLLEGKDLLKLSDEEMRQTRATEISMIPQGAMNSLNANTGPDNRHAARSWRIENKVRVSKMGHRAVRAGRPDWRSCEHVCP